MAIAAAMVIRVLRLTGEEVAILKKIWPEVKPYLRSEGISVIEEEGTSVKDFENDTVTPLIGNEECAYSILEGNIFMCGIEKTWSEGKITFQKPVSCHLFPARIKQFKGFQAVNYQELSICHSALRCGQTQGIYVYEFLKVPLIRALGEETYNELCIAAEELRKNPKNLTTEFLCNCIVIKSYPHPNLPPGGRSKRKKQMIYSRRIIEAKQNLGVSLNIKAKAKELRKNQTKQEKALWDRLRNRQLSGKHFRRQHPYNIYIIDFYCFESSLAIEIDGEIHLKQKEHDLERTGVLESSRINGPSI